MGSAIVGTIAGLVSTPVTVIVGSGRRLSVDVTLSRAAVTGIRLMGEARFVATGVLDPEGFA